MRLFVVKASKKADDAAKLGTDLQKKAGQWDEVAAVSMCTSGQKLRRRCAGPKLSEYPSFDATATFAEAVQGLHGPFRNRSAPAHTSKITLLAVGLGSVMAMLWTQVASVAGWVCQPTSFDNASNDQILQLQSALEEMRLLLNHEQRVSQELKGQVRDERRRREMLQREMQDKLELQDREMKSLLAELETAKKAMHQKKNEIQGPLVETSEKPRKVHSHGRECETELLAALLEHATKQATACPAVKKEATALQQLRSELEVAQGKASEAQEATEELRQQLQQEKASRSEVEHLLELQRESLVREVHNRKTFEAQVAEFLQLLGQRNALHGMLLQWSA